jgi:hypothetical protein
MNDVHQQRQGTTVDLEQQNGRLHRRGAAFPPQHAATVHDREQADRRTLTRPSTPSRCSGMRSPTVAGTISLTAETGRAQSKSPTPNSTRETRVALAMSFKETKIPKTQGLSNGIGTPGGIQQRSQIGRPLGPELHRSTSEAGWRKDNHAACKACRGGHGCKLPAPSAAAFPDTPRLASVPVDRVAQDGVPDVGQGEPGSGGSGRYEAPSRSSYADGKPGEEVRVRCGATRPAGLTVIPFPVPRMPADRCFDGQGSRFPGGPQARRGISGGSPDGQPWAAPSLRWARSVLATTIRPEVSRSSRWTMPGRPSAPPDRLVPRAAEGVHQGVVPMARVPDARPGQPACRSPAGARPRRPR